MAVRLALVGKGKRVVRRFGKLVLGVVFIAASLAMATPVAAAGSVSPLPVSTKAVTVVPLSPALVQTTGANPALSCLAYAYATGSFNYAGPDSYQMKGTACLNGSNSWGIAVSWKSLNGAQWRTAPGGGPSYYNVGGNTMFMINGYAQGISSEVLPRLYLYQVGTTWYETCYDGGNSQYFVNCSVS